METDTVDRRKFLKLAGIGCALVTAPALLEFGFRKGGTDSIFFHVAGARFYSVNKHLKTGVPVKVAGGTFEGAKCYAIHAEGTIIGYVPKQLVPLVGHLGIKSACLSSVDIYAVPWKRYGVTLRTNRVDDVAGWSLVRSQQKVSDRV